MTLRICHEWEEIEYIEATCPYCHVIDTYFYPGYGKDCVLTCQNEKCNRQFILGEQE